MVGKRKERRGGREAGGSSGRSISKDERAGI